VPSGVSVDLAHALARRLDVPLELVSYDAAGAVVSGATRNEWDIAFVAVDPVRGADIIQTSPYLTIDGSYMVPQDSPITHNDQVDQPGIRILVSTGSAYALYLSRNLQRASLVHTTTSPTIPETLLEQGYEVAAGVRQQLVAAVARLSGLRMLEGRFMTINQAMGTPKGRGTAGGEYLREFVEEMRANGFVAEAITRNKAEGAAVAPAGGA
jgi:polar amino acid transport system substrate-binding protein